MDELAGRYVTLCLRVARLEPAVVTAYAGPDRLVAAVSEEGRRSPEVLAADADRLAVDVAREPTLPADRADWLVAQLVALGTVARRLAGEDLPFGELTRHLLGVGPEPAPWEVFEKAHRRLEEVLPGTGPVAPRLERFRETVTVPPDRVRPLLAGAVAGLRGPAAEHYRFPGDATLEVAAAPDGRDGHGLPRGMGLPATHRHLGDHRGRIEIPDRPVTATGLLRVALALGWPGRHGERVCRQALLVEEFGRGELTVITAPTPESVVSAGIAAQGGRTLIGESLRRDLLGEILEAVDAVVPAEEALAVAQALPPVEAALATAALRLHGERWAAADCTDLLERLSLRPAGWCAEAVGRLADLWTAVGAVADAEGTRRVGAHLESRGEAARALRHLVTSQLTPQALDV